MSNTNKAEHPEAVARAIAVLNEALAADPEAVNRFMSLEVQINQALAGHPTIQVGGSVIDPSQDGCVMRPLGLINGLFGVDENDWGFIAMEAEDDRIVRFTVLPSQAWD